MGFSKPVLAAFFMVAASLSLLFTSNCRADIQATDMRPGDWAKYIGSFPNDEYEWVRVSVVNVDSNELNVSMSYDVRYPYKVSRSGYAPPEYKRHLLIDVTSGFGNIFLFFIPANLSVGEVVPVPSGYEKLSIEGTAIEAYAGLNRTVVYASYSDMPWGGEGTLYWDKQTGLLVEIMAKVGNPSFPAIRLVETNLWSMSLADWVANNLLFMALAPASVALQMGVLLMLIKRREVSDRVTRPREGIVLTGMGVVLLVTAIMNLTNFSQSLFSVSLVFGLALLGVGIIAYHGLWAGINLKVDLGVILLSLSVPLFANALAFAMYRELGALVPTIGVSGIYRTYEDIEAVFFYPHAWLVSPIATVAISLALCGILNLYKPRVAKS